MAEVVATVVEVETTAANNHGVVTRADMVATRVATKPDHRVATDNNKAMETNRATVVDKVVTPRT